MEAIEVDRDSQGGLGRAWAKAIDGILEDDPLVISLACALRLDAVVTDRTFFAAFDATSSACCTGPSAS